MLASPSTTFSQADTEDMDADDEGDARNSESNPDAVDPDQHGIDIARQPRAEYNTEVRQVIVRREQVRPSNGSKACPNTIRCSLCLDPARVQTRVGQGLYRGLYGCLHTFPYTCVHTCPRTDLHTYSTQTSISQIYAGDPSARASSPRDRATAPATSRRNRRPASAHAN